MSQLLKDATNRATRALPNGANTVVQATGIDTGNSSRGDFVAPAELFIEAPALTVGELANAATMTYDVVGSVNADLSSPTVLGNGILVQTGAGGAGAPAATKRFRLPTNTPRYVGIRITNSSTGNPSAKTATASLVV